MRLHKHRALRLLVCGSPQTLRHPTFFHCSPVTVQLEQGSWADRAGQVLVAANSQPDAHPHRRSLLIYLLPTDSTPSCFSHYLSLFALDTQHRYHGRRKSPRPLRRSRLLRRETRPRHRCSHDSQCVRAVLCALCSVLCALITDLLYSLRDDDMGYLLGLQTKDLHKLCGKLKEDRMLHVYAYAHPVLER